MQRLLPFYVLLLMWTHYTFTGSTNKATRFLLRLVPSVVLLLMLLIPFSE